MNSIGSFILIVGEFYFMMFLCNLILLFIRKEKLRWLKIEQKLVDLDIAVKTSLHVERPAADQCISALDQLNELALTPLMLKKQPDIVTTIRYFIIFNPFAFKVRPTESVIETVGNPLVNSKIR